MLNLVLDDRPDLLVRAEEQVMTKALTRIALSLAMGASIVGETTPVRSESVAEMFPYKAPSGMFNEGSAKTDHYRFFHEDAERMANLRAGRGFVSSAPPSSEVREAAHPRTGSRTPRWSSFGRP